MRRGTINDIDAHLPEATESFGAPRWRAFFEVTVLLSLPGLVSAFRLGYALAIGAFTVPLFLGRGIVLIALLERSDGWRSPVAVPRRACGARSPAP